MHPISLLTCNFLGFLKDRAKYVGEIFKGTRSKIGNILNDPLEIEKVLLDDLKEEDYDDVDYFGEERYDFYPTSDEKLSIIEKEDQT